jgi:hypothetical protein
MKILITLLALAVAAINGAMLLPQADALGFPLTCLSLVLAVVIVIAIHFLRPKAQTSPAAAPVQVNTPPPAIPENQAEAEIVAFLGMLQEKGRFIDFVMDDVTAYDDAQVGAAARVVHQGCRRVLNECFSIKPVADAPEGESFTVPPDGPADAYRLTGKVGGTPPFRGTLVHKGWQTEKVNLPRVLHKQGSPLPAIAPAEVELR